VEILRLQIERKEIGEQDVERARDVASRFRAKIGWSAQSRRVAGSARFVVHDFGLLSMDANVGEDR
jgi:hypothetical protein